MTDRHEGYIVALETDLRDDDAQATITALSRIKGVVSVKPVLAGPHQMVADMRAHRRWVRALSSMMREGPPELDELL